MKKMFFIILAVMLTGCINPDSSNGPVVQRDKTMYIEYSDGLHRAITPVYFIYNGHKYITFMGPQSHSTVHDPDCDCYLKHKNNDY